MTTLIIGERGEGKTTLAKYIARQRSRVSLMFEPKPDGSVSDCVKTYDEMEFYEAIEDAKESADQTIICFVPGDDVEEGFNEFCDVIESGDPRTRYLYGGITIIIDEAWSLMTPNKSHPKLENLLRLAPRDGCAQINVIVLAHKPVDINQRTHTFSEELFLFRLTEQSDLDRIRERWRPEVADAVETFPDGGHYVARYDKNSRIVEVWDDPSIWAPQTEVETKGER